MSSATKTRAWEILLVEDNPADIRLTQEALRLCTLSHVLHVARDGEQALSMLRCEGQYGALPVPDLVLLDLNLPRKNGYQVLTEIKDDPRTVQIPVIVLSTSSTENDVADCYRRHANCYLQKPLNFDDFVALIREVHKFWLGRVVLPPRSESKSP
jgi:CheY-like chemotaxis protein